MKYCIIRRVAYKFPGTSRILWANILCEREGLALLLVPKSTDHGSHSLVLARENVSDRLFESEGGNMFDLETNDMGEVGKKLRILAKEFSFSEFTRHLFDSDDWG